MSSKAILVSSLATGLLTLIPAAGVLAQGADDPQLSARYARMLFDPSAEQRELERQGRVMIYSGLRESTVDRALDEQFDRISSMMFVRTVVATDQGEEEAEDDGC